MKTKIGTLKIGGLVLILSVFIFFILRANNITTEKQKNQNLFEIKNDTLRNPNDEISEQRTTSITIINGKKKIQETIIKMKGDSIIEKKVIEKEEDAPEDGSMMYNYNFNFPDGNDSLFGGNNQRYNFGIVPMDSLMNSFRMQFESPGFNFNFGDSSDNWPDNFFDQFQNDSDGFGGNMSDLIDEMFKNYNFDTQEIPGWNGNKNNLNNNAPKTLNEIIKENLLNDGFITDIDQKYQCEITNKGLKIDGKKQDKRVFEKYKKIIEDNTGVELDDDFSFNFNNEKQLKLETKRI
ncbi:MAG: hypothetical protein R2771_08115 [Saprospiraceae bacterium]